MGNTKCGRPALGAANFLSFGAHHRRPYKARLVALTKVENDPMKKPIVEFFLLCLSVEVVTSL